MKKLIALSSFAVIILVGCSSTPVEIEEPMGPQTVIYKGQSAVSTEEGYEGQYTTVIYEMTEDDITNVKFDTVLPEGEFSTTSKKELSDKGEYGLEEASGKSWTEHVTELEMYINENDKFPMLNEEGKDADGASGATIGLSTFEEAFNAAAPV